MRIIAGKYRSRRLLTPKDAITTRPIPDRVKESVFGLLRGHFEGSAVLDCFAGTGAIGLEALSRGAEHVVMVERDRKIADLLRRNIESLGVEDQAELVIGDALGPAALARCPKPVHLIFFDPPYPLVLDSTTWPRIVKALERLSTHLTNTGYIILRTPSPMQRVEVLDEDGEPLPSSQRRMFDAFGRYHAEWAHVGRIDEEREANRRGSRGADRDGRGRRSVDDRDDRREEDDHDDELIERSWVGDDLDIDAIQAESDAELEGLDAEELDADVGLEEGAMDSGGAHAGELERAPNDAPFKYTLRRSAIELDIPGTIGPETHTYASQAVHLFMKRCGEPASGEADSSGEV
jgi:16S rRNA (guanine966-N2)-methyltransferase